MNDDFCVIAKRKGTTRFDIINHTPISQLDARILASSKDLEESRISRFAVAKSVVNFMNGADAEKPLKEEALLEKLELEISNRIKKYAMITGRTGKKIKIDEIFVGHENYEVQVILGE